MPSDRAGNIGTIAGSAPHARGFRPPGAALLSGERFAGISTGRATRFASRARDDRAPPPRRVSLEGTRLPRVRPAAIASGVQLVDFAVVFAAGIASFALQSRIASLLSFLPAATAVLVLALMLRRLTAASHPEDWARRRLGQLLGDGLAHMLAAFGFALLAAVAVFQPGPAAREPL